MKGPLGYGRYNSDVMHVGCPRARSDMTPCIARDGNLALSDDDSCVACDSNPHSLVSEAMAVATGDEAADVLQNLVRVLTHPDRPAP